MFSNRNPAVVKAEMMRLKKMEQLQEALSLIGPQIDALPNSNARDALLGIQRVILLQMHKIKK